MEFQEPMTTNSPRPSSPFSDNGSDDMSFFDDVGNDDPAVFAAPGPDLVRQCSTTDRRLFILVDNSYLFIAAQKIQAQRLGLLCEFDARARLHLEQLCAFVCGPGRGIHKAILYGSEPPALYPIAQQFKQIELCSDIETRIYKRSLSGRQAKRVDTDIISDIMFLPMDAPEGGTLILISGSQTAASACHHLLATTDNFDVEIVGFHRSISTSYMRIAQEFPGRMCIKHFDDYLPRFVFSKYGWDTAHQRAPRDRSMIISFATVSESPSDDNSTSQTERQNSEANEANEFIHAFARLRNLAREASVDPEAEAAKALLECDRRELLVWIAEHLTNMLQVPIMTFWHDDTHIAACIVPSRYIPDSLVEQCFLDLATVTARLAARLEHSPHRLSVKSVQPMTQFEHSVSIPAGTSVLDIPLSQSASSSSSSSSSSSGRDSDDWTPVCPIAKPQYKQQYSEQCYFGFRCRKGKTCPYFHTATERQFFKLNNGVGNPRYKKFPCMMKKCPHIKEPWLCYYRHETDADC
jgi:hypothetical protein